MFIVNKGYYLVCWPNTWLDKDGDLLNHKGGNIILCEFESRFPLVVKCGISLIDYDPIFENFLSLFF